MIEVLRAVGVAAYLFGAYITYTCPCDPLWKCHAVEMNLLNGGLFLLVATTSMAGASE